MKNQQQENYNMNKLPVTVFMKDHINKIRNIDALGVYAYLMSCFQNAGITPTFDQVLKMISVHFKISENESRKSLDYLMELEIGLEDLIMK